MPLPKVHEDLISIVLLGNFNPAIFQPAWLAAKGLVRESEANEAIIKIIHPEAAQYRLGWLDLTVTRERFHASTADPSYREPLRDLVVSIFGLLEQTPTTKLGLNRSMEIDMVDVEKWHALGDLVAPKEPWSGILEKPGMLSLVMRASRTDDARGRVHFRVEPSAKYQHAAFFDVNSEFHADPEHPNDATGYFMKRIRNDWDRVLREAFTSIEKLVDQIVKGQE